MSRTARCRRCSDRNLAVLGCSVRLDFYHLFIRKTYVDRRMEETWSHLVQLDRFWQLEGEQIYIIYFSIEMLTSRSQNFAVSTVNWVFVYIFSSLFFRMAGSLVDLDITVHFPDHHRILPTEIHAVNSGYGRIDNRSRLPLHLFRQPISPALLQLRSYDW